MSEKMKTSTRKFIRGVAAAAILLLIIWKIVDGSLIYSNAVPARNSKSGQTVEIHIHGRDLYITPEQQIRLGPFHWTSGIFVLLIGCVVFFGKSSEPNC